MRTDTGYARHSVDLEAEQGMILVYSDVPARHSVRLSQNDVGQADARIDPGELVRLLLPRSVARWVAFGNVEDLRRFDLLSGDGVAFGSCGRNKRLAGYVSSLFLKSLSSSSRRSIRSPLHLHGEAALSGFQLGALCARLVARHASHAEASQFSQ